MSTKTHEHRHPDTEEVPANDVESERQAPRKPRGHEQRRIYCHSSFFYWWPVWVVGFVMALLTYWQGKTQQIEDIGPAREWIHPNTNLGVVFFLVLFLVAR